MIERGIYFGDIHSYYDFELILSAVEITAALPKTNYIDIPGGDGSIDLTEVHGDVKYNDRDCKFTFSAAKSINESEWEELKTKVNNALNGRTFKITLDKDPDYYYFGRCTINEYMVNKRLRQIVVGAKVAPWKYKQAVTIISADLPSNGIYKTVYLPNGRKPVCPTIESTGDFELIISGGKISGGAGTFSPADYNFALRLRDGGMPVMAAGTGTIKFIYQEGDL